MVPRLSAEVPKRLDFDSETTFLNFFENTDFVKTEPVIRFDVDLEISCISAILDKSITDFEIFFSAAGVKLVSRASIAASLSKTSGLYLGQIYLPAIKYKVVNKKSLIIQ